MSLKRNALPIAVVLILVIGIGVYSYINTEPPEEEEIVLKVFHAGSLTVPLEEVEARFEADYPNVDVQLEPAGSVQCVQKVTEIGELADVVASADYSLIPSMMMPDYADWYIVFAKNEMTLAYAETSRYADEINEENWYEVLQREDVKWGFSNPNLDPCGYRTPMVIQLAEAEYGDDTLFENMVSAYCGLTCSETGGIYTIDSNMEDLTPDTDKLSIRDKSVELVSLVESGGLDYAFEYSSVAKQHGMMYLDLPASIDLSELSYANTYATVKVEKTSGTSTGKPIVYGVTVPSNALHPEYGALFIQYMIDDTGDSVFDDLGQPPINPAVVDAIEAAPESLIPFISEQD